MTLTNFNEPTLTSVDSQHGNNIFVCLLNNGEAKVAVKVAIKSVNSFPISPRLSFRHIRN